MKENQPLFEFSFSDELKHLIKSTSQSSIRLGKDSSRGIDNNINTNVYTNYDWRAWWRAVFSRKIALFRVKIVSRQDCCLSRISNVDVVILPSKTLCGNTGTLRTNGQSVTIRCSSPMTPTDIVEFKMNNNVQIHLNFAEAYFEGFPL